jgi:hypothetical protein
VREIREKEEEIFFEGMRRGIRTPYETPIVNSLSIRTSGRDSYEK